MSSGSVGHEELRLGVRKRRTHQCDYIWEARLVNSKAIEESLDGDQTFFGVLFGTVKIEKNIFPEPRGKAVLARLRGEVVVDGSAAIDFAAWQDAVGRLLHPEPTVLEKGRLTGHRCTPSPKCLQDCGGLQGTAGDSRGLGGATDSAENRALTTEVARHRSFLNTLDAGSIPAASSTDLGRSFVPRHFWRGTRSARFSLRR